MIYDEQNSPNGKLCWTIVDGKCQQVKVESALYLPGDLSVRYQKLDGSREVLVYHSGMQFADTREELLTHLISQKREAIAELERAIEGLDALREPEWPDVIGSGLGEPVSVKKMRCIVEQ